MARVLIYDTTLRDGTQWEGLSLSVQDKLKITQKLDEFQVDYIEGGWPGSNPKDAEFFGKARHLDLKHARLVAFGSTRRPNAAVETDYNIRMLVEAETPGVALVAKTWDLHVRDALRTTLDENLAMIHDSVTYLKSLGREVVFDAEHFFDGYRSNPDYALEVLRTAARAGADSVVLCDTNGGSMPWEVAELARQVGRMELAPLGIHTHNDTANAVANALAAVRAGVVQVQGTINGYGERCGNADLTALIPNLVLKMKHECATGELLPRLTELSWYVSEVANLSHDDHQPYVGKSAFAHKGGIHVSAVMRNTVTYEHIDPTLVGNERHIVVSELAGRSNLLFKAETFGLELPEGSDEAQKVLQRIKELEYQGYQFEAAEASLELLMRKSLGVHTPMFELRGFRVTVDRRGEGEPVVEATAKVCVDGREEHTAAEGNGPVNALDAALRKALEEFFPDIRKMHLVDYKVRVLDASDGTAARVRVLIETADEHGTWTTVGVHENVLEASWLALADSIEYGLARQAGTLRPVTVAAQPVAV